MAYICLDCYEVFEENVMRNVQKVNYAEGRDWLFCPITSCGGNVIEVDELLLPVIKILNKKGYNTKFCCAGHTYDNYPNTYINFEKDVEIPNLPQGFEFDKVGINNGMTIRKDYKKYKKNEIRLYKEIVRSSLILLAWTRKLPDINE